MAAIVQAGLAINANRMQWALEQRFPKPSTRPDNLNHMQSVHQEIACAIYCGDQLLIPAANFDIWSRMELNPL
jgi:hypothetical protein